MIFLDANIVVHLIVKDNHEQTKKANKIFESIISWATVGFVEDSVIAEVLQVTVSKKIYAVQKSSVVELLLPLLSVEGIDHNYKPQLRVALKNSQSQVWASLTVRH